jgi:hypothetical protein
VQAPATKIETTIKKPIVKTVGFLLCPEIAAFIAALPDALPMHKDFEHLQQDSVPAHVTYLDHTLNR